MRRLIILWALFSLNVFLPAEVFANGTRAALRARVSGQGATLDTTWREFTSEAGAFSVRFPGVPEAQTLTRESFGAMITMRQHILDRAGREADYFEASYMDLPNASEADLLADITIDNINRTLAGRGGRITQRSPVRLDECEGREFTGQDAGSGFMLGRIFISGARMYVLVYSAGSQDARARQTAGVFLDSFRIRGGCVPARADEAAPIEVRRGREAGTLDRATGWRLIAPTGAGFSVLMPSAADSEAQLMQTDPFPLTVTSYASESRQAIYAAVVGGDFPSNIMRQQNHFEIILDIAYRALLKELEGLGTINFERELRVGQYPGRQYGIAAGDRSGRAQIYATQHKFYFFMALTERRGVWQQNLDRFFASIRIIPQ